MNIHLLPDHMLVLTGMAIVSVVSANIFNSWTREKSEKYGYTDQPRHYTTFMRFNCYRCVYILFMLAGYLILLAFPDLLEIFGVSISSEKADKIREQSYLWAALAVTGIVPNFPIIQTWEAKIRDKLQNYAFTPFEAQRIISIFEDDYNTFQPREAAIRSVLKKIGEKHNDIDDFTSNRNDSLRHKWCKLSYLYMMIRKRKAAEEFSRYISCCDKLLFEKLEKEYSDIKKDINKRIALVETNGENEEATPWVEPIKIETEKILNGLLTRCYKLISCGILTTEKLNQNRIDAFQYFGLTPSSFINKIPINWNIILKSSMVVFCSAFVPTIIYYYIFKASSYKSEIVIYPQSGLEAFAWCLIGLAMFSFGLMGAVLVERLFWRRQSQKGENPLTDKNVIVHSCISAVLGYFIGISVLIFYTILKKKGPLIDLEPSIFLFPFLPAVSSFLTTHFIETQKEQYLKYFGRRTMETLTIGIFNALGGLMIMLILEITDIPSILYVVVTAGLIGAGIGYTFIEGYRNRLRPAHERRRENRYSVTEDATLILDDKILDCQVISITASSATINIDVPIDMASARLKMESLDEIPVVISKRSRKKTILQFLFNAISEKKFKNRLKQMDESSSLYMQEGFA